MLVFVSLTCSKIKCHHHIVIWYKCPLVKVGMFILAGYTPPSATICSKQDWVIGRYGECPILIYYSVVGVAGGHDLHNHI